MDGEEAVDEGAVGTGDVTGTNEPAQTQPELSEHGNSFLSNIQDPNEKQVLAKYLPQWDAGFTKYATATKEKYKPYEELGEVEELRKAKGILEQLTTDPSSVIDFFYQNRDHFGLEWKWQLEKAAEQAAEQESLPDYLKPIQDQVSKLPQFEKALTQVASYIQQQEQAARQKAEDEKLENDLKALKMQYGDFDLDFVLNKAERNGYKLEDAVKEFKALEQRFIQQAAAKPPSNILSGGAAPQNTGKSPAEMTPQERKQALLAQLSGLQS